MNLTVLTPIGMILQTKISKITVETLNGYYTLLPKHIDFVSAFGPNIMTYQDADAVDKYVACHRGIIVKKGNHVTVSTQHALLGNKLDELAAIVQEDYKNSEEQRKELNIAMARLELGIVRGFSRIKGEM